MLGDLKRMYRGMRLKSAEGHINTEEPYEPKAIPASTLQVKEELLKTFTDSFDFNIKMFQGNIALMANIDGLVDKLLTSESIVNPMLALNDQLKKLKPDVSKIDFLGDKLPSICDLKVLEDFNECVVGIMSGNTILFVDGETKALNISLQKHEKRAIIESESEGVMRGSRESFMETITTNVTLLRRIINDSNLVFEMMRIGRQTKTKVAICYIKGVANREIIDTVRKRLKNIRTDAILESGYLEEYISDAPMSIFPTVFNTERPESVAGKLLEGRVAIICNGTPFVMTVPGLFIDYLQFGEDYNNRWVFSIIVRFIRLSAFFISVTSPAYFIALLCFHQDVIPLQLAMTFESARQGVPFSPLVEMLILTFLFELIKESGLRMSRLYGQAVALVGALIIGEAAVQAGIFSAPAVVVIAITSLSAFIISKLDATVFVMRLTLMFAANTIGLLGIFLVSILFFAYMCSLKSFGVPYLSPVTPLAGKDMKDAFVRIPIWAIFEKPETVTRRYGEKDNRND